MAALDTRSLRNVLGCYATGVAVLTTRSAAGEHVGVTVNSFSSVSLDPPLILFSLLKSAAVLTHFQQAKHFNVNILSHRQEAVSNMFARPSSAQWDAVNFSEGEDGCALLHGSIAQIECDSHAELDGGDHRIFLGMVTRFHLMAPGEPLLFYRGRYGTYQRDFWSGKPPADSSLTELGPGETTGLGWG
jgi:flavin reductase (DIM6/NTAB) family NADH-FMN oxidoreductase RutF